MNDTTEKKIKLIDRSIETAKSRIATASDKDDRDNAKRLLRMLKEKKKELEES